MIYKTIFRVPNRILTIYEQSPHYIGTLLWNELPQYIQESNSVFEFKREIDKRNRTFVNL